MRALLFLLLITSTSIACGQDFQKDVKPFLKKYCLKCHSGKEPDGDADFSVIRTTEDAITSFDLWRKASKHLRAREMPPEEELQPTNGEVEQVLNWYQTRFIETVEASPGQFQPRRLAVYEYRNTLESMLGFELEVGITEAEQTKAEKSLVVKLLPIDPPGRSGFTNDTHGNPLTTVTWDQYSYLVDAGLAELFSSAGRKHLESYTGAIPESGLSLAQAEKMVRTFVPRAFRRTVDEADLAAVVARLEQGDDLLDTLKAELKVVLMSPAFIYRGLLMKGSAGQRQPVDDFELAERLSYFIWGDMPDQELMSLASEGKLNDPKIYEAQIDRLLQSSKSRSLAVNFGVEWFGLDEIDQLSNNPPLAIALKSQPVDFVQHLFTAGRPLMELIDSRTAFVSPLMAGHYDKKDRQQMTPYRKLRGIEVEAVPNQKIILEHTTYRGGILTIPGVLAMNKGPVLRGTWMLERILGEHLPDPPADVGQVPGNKRGQNLTFRQRFELHRSNASCAVCHDKIDPLGFALQSYDAKGGHNKNEGKSNQVLDASGQLPSGEKFDDFAGLKRVLVTSQRERIIRNIVKQTLSYALCRKLELHDQPTVEKMVADLNDNDGTFRDLVQLIAHSLPFRETVFGKTEK